ncbi:hypothetical protein Pint_24450 [Pistacia integerrima]|uniref:Uncharacterized protein n=1 Tax=Pistacia integerrima TaxID=434235 RepID=A0ACC0YEQ7_9ROSI|nr:hypothetical protein Pint_24450 [Pistacia integerrima]
MCGGAIISDLIDLKRGRKLTAEDLWSELDTISDLLGLDYAKQFDAQKPGQPQKAACVDFGFENEFYQPSEVGSNELGLEEQISSLESFLGLEPTSRQLSGNSECDSVDFWMLDDVVAPVRVHQQNLDEDQLLMY